MRVSRIMKSSKGLAAFTAGTALIAAGVFGGFAATATAAEGTPDPAATSVATSVVSPSLDPTPTTDAPAPADTQQAAPAPAETTPAPVPAPAEAVAPQAKVVSSDSRPSPYHSNAPPSNKVTICHRTNSASNPYEQITVDTSAVDGVGKSDHYGKHPGPLASSTVVAQQLKDNHTKWGDIIPPLAEVHKGLNWTSEGQAIYNADCVVPAQPVHTQVTPKYNSSTYTCNTETYTVEGANTLTLTGQEGVVWTITKGSDTQTRAAGAGFNGLPSYGVGTYTISGTDASSSDLIDVTPVTATVSFVSSDSVDCTPPPPTDVCKNIAGDQETVPVGFVQNGEDCAPVHNECTTSTVDASVWTTEDGAPTVGDDGADFSTPNALDKVNYFGKTLNIPFAGISGGSYTVKNTGGPITAYDMEVFQTGTSSFATIVFEPYMNGLTGTGTSGDGTFHTYAITASSLVWNSKIVSGEGSQDHPVTLTRMQELIPTATLIRAGLAQGKNNAGSLSTVSNFTDPACGVTVFPKKPAVVASSATIDSVCAAEGTDVTAHLVAGTSDSTFQILINGVKVGEKSVKAGEVFDYTTTLAEDSSGGSATVEVKTGEVSLTGEISVSTDCLPPVTIIATPPAPKVTAPTCTADGSLPPLVDGDGYTAAYNRSFDGPGVYTVIYTITAENSAFATGGTVSYDLTVAKKLTENCTTPTPPATTPPTTPPTTTPPTIPSSNGGANTGMFGDEPGAQNASSSFGVNQGIIGGVALLVALMALIGLSIVISRRKRIHADSIAGVE